MKIGLALGEHWRLAVSDNCLVLTRINGRRPDPIHLTLVSRRSDTGEVDVHLTYGHQARMAGEIDAKDRQTICRFQPEAIAETSASIARAVDALGTEMRSGFRRFRPGWLKRNGYVVHVADEGDVVRLMRHAFPKIRKKYRLSEANLERLKRSLPSAGIEAYCPSVLHDLAGIMLDHPELKVIAYPPDPRVPGMPLTFRPEAPGSGWYGKPPNEFRGPVLRAWSQIAQHLRPVVDAERIELVIRELELDDLAYMRKAIAALRRWLATPG